MCICVSNCGSCTVDSFACCSPVHFTSSPSRSEAAAACKTRAIRLAAWLLCWLIVIRTVNILVFKLLQWLLLILLSHGLGASSSNLSGVSPLCTICALFCCTWGDVIKSEGGCDGTYRHAHMTMWSSGCACPAWICGAPISRSLLSWRSSLHSLAQVKHP